MNNKIKNYVDVLFAEVPRSKKANDLKEEMLSNMSERFDEYISQGKTEIQAYSLVVSNMGDVDDLLAEVMPDEEFKLEAGVYRRRNAKNTAIAVAMYIVAVAILIFMVFIGEMLNAEDTFAIMGVVLLLVIAAVATGILVYTNMSTPIEMRDFDNQTRQERRIYASKDGLLYKNLMSIYWSVITLVYLAVSFLTMQWGITWIIWVLAGVLSQIITTIFEMRNTDE